MVTRKELLKNIRNYSPQEIAEAVKAGVVSMYDLKTETGGAFTPLLKRQVKDIIDTPPLQQNTILENSTEHIDCLKQQIKNTENVSEVPVPPPYNPVKKSAMPIVPVPGFVEEKDVVKSVNEISSQMSFTDTKRKQKLFSKVFSFKGRIRRLEYGFTYLGYCIWNIPINFIPEEQIPDTYAIIYLMVLFPLFWILLAQGAKRCHDRGNSGWYQLIPFYVLFLIFAEGDSETNKYGDSPK